ncbi:MAG: menaquinone biosynthesis protein [Candidatus Electrothrix sp. YB6]
MARIGMVNYINTAPIYEVWKEQVHRPDWLVTEAPPVELNRLLAAGELDLGFVSSIEYAVRPQQYRIMADLSIAATGPVGSVFLFSSVPPEQLDSRPVLLTGQSDTSVRLLQIILEDFFAVRPQYLRGDISAPQPQDHDHGERPEAVLAIGDDALRLAMEKQYPVQLDLGEFWHRHTDLPFVFAVCAVREDFLQAEPAAAREIHQALLTCRDQGLARLPAISRQAARRIPMDKDACLCYLQAMEYDLDPRKQQALEEFFTRLLAHGKADSKALPLKIMQ